MSNPQDIFFRNDIPSSTFYYYAPAFYLAALSVPFLWLSDLFFRKTRSDEAEIVYFKIHKGSFNPFFNAEGFQVTFYNDVAQTEKKFVVASDVDNDPEAAIQEIVDYLHLVLSTARTKPIYLVSWDAHHQGLALSQLLKRVRCESLLRRIRFFDIKMLFLNRYTDLQNVAFEDMVDMLGLPSIKPRVYLYKLAFDAILERYGENVNTIYDDIYVV